MKVACFFCHIYLANKIDPESRSGQYLLRRAEFHGQVESRSTALIAQRQPGEDGLIPQAKLICGKGNFTLD